MTKEKWTASHETVQRALEVWEESCAAFSAYHPKPDPAHMLVDYHADKRRAAMRAALEATMGELVQLLDDADDTVQWMSGAAVFGEGGEAHAAWTMYARPTLKRISDTLSRLRGEAEEAAS